MQDDVGREAGGEQVAGQDQVDVELEAGVVEDDVDAALLIAGFLGSEQQIEGGGEVVDEDVLLGCLPRLGALELLDVLVGQVGEEGQVGRVAPEADLAHLHEEDLFGLLVDWAVLSGFGLADLGDQVLVTGGQLEDGRARGPEGLDLLAGEDVVVLPVRREAEGGAYPSMLEKVV